MILKSRRNLALACALSAMAGYVDGIGFLHLGGLFVSFMSGNSARLGVSLAQAQAKLKLSAQDFGRKFPRALRPTDGFTVTPFQDAFVSNVRPILLVLAGAVGLVLLIACANVANLLLVRATARRREIAIRAAIGAGRGRIIRQLLTESILLSVTGAAVGVLVAYRGTKAISTMLPYYSFPHEAAIHVNGMVVLFSAAVALLTGILFGISPAWQLSQPQLGSLIRWRAVNRCTLDHFFVA